MKEPTELAKELLELTVKWRDQHILWSLDECQETFNAYDDTGDEVKALVKEILMEHSIKFTTAEGLQRTVQAKGKTCFWENGHWLRWVDNKNYWRGIRWLAIEQIEII